MKSQPKKKINLAIETGIYGGSVSVFTNNEQTGFWIGENKVSRSEDVLQAISTIFEENNLLKNEISQIIVSDNPGSFTGLRIGLSIALGLKNAFNANLLKVSALDAIEVLLPQNPQNNDIVIAVPVGHNILWKITGNNSDINFTGKLPDFIEFIESNRKKTLILHRRIYDQISCKSNIIDAGENIAYLIGKYYNKICV